MEGKKVFITGATSGIGKETAIALSKMGATIFMTARDKESGERARQEIVSQSGNNGIEVYECDLSSFSSIRVCVEKFSQQETSLDVLINNAGVGITTRELSKDGIELHFAVNFLAPFLLTHLLLPLLRKSEEGRIINVCSTLHREGHIDFNDIESKEHFDHYKAYGNSKLALLLFTKKLAKDLMGTSVTVNALHPGVINTDLTKQMMGNTNPLVKKVYSLTMMSEKDGAKTSVYLASSEEVKGVSGEYFEKMKITESSPESYNMVVAEKICEIAEQMTSLRK